MKKLLTLIITLIMIIPFAVNAATSPNVKTVDATVSGATIKYTGTTEDGIYAVMCKLFDKDNNEVDLLSSAVDSNAFSGELTATATGDYKVSCARYEGGDIVSADVKVESVPATEETTKTVPTGDNVKTYVIIAMVSIIAIAGATVYLKKRVKNN